MSTVDALKKYGWLKNYWWKAVSVTADEYTMLTEEKGFNGYFIRALPGVKTIFPLQACLFIGEDQLAQNVHNIIITEENSELHIITGCTVAPYVKSALHVGVSEFFVGKNAKISFTMIHSWSKDVDVRPRTGKVGSEKILELLPVKPEEAKSSLEISKTVKQLSIRTVRDHLKKLADKGLVATVKARMRRGDQS
jgi:hypothetical protein